MDCMPGDTCATPAECCVDSSTSGNEVRTSSRHSCPGAACANHDAGGQYNRCLDRCEPTVASRSPTSQAVVVPLESCCIVDYTKCHEWECVAYCNKVYLSTSSVPGFLAKSQEIKAYCDAFNAVVKSRGQSCRAYSGGIARDEGGGGSGLDCTGQKYVEAKTSLLDRSHHGCIRCVSSGLKYCPADGRCAEDPNNEAEVVGPPRDPRRWILLYGLDRSTCHGISLSMSPRPSDSGAGCRAQVEDKEPLRCPASCVGEFYPVLQLPLATQCILPTSSRGWRAQLPLARRMHT